MHRKGQQRATIIQHSGVISEREVIAEALSGPTPSLSRHARSRQATMRQSVLLPDAQLSPQQSHRDRSSSQKEGLCCE